jgi:hypothetical protein
MKTLFVFTTFAVIISAVYFNVLSVFELPHSTMEWIISDVVLGIILYLGYLAIVASVPSKTKSRNLVTA